MQLLIGDSAPFHQNNGCQGCQEEKACSHIQHIQLQQVWQGQAAHEGCRAKHQACFLAELAESAGCGAFRVSTRACVRCGDSPQ